MKRSRTSGDHDGSVDRLEMTKTFRNGGTEQIGNIVRRIFRPHVVMRLMTSQSTTLENIERLWNFIISFSRPGKSLKVLENSRIFLPVMKLIVTVIFWR